MLLIAMSVGLDAPGDLDILPPVVIDFTAAAASYPHVTYVRTGSSVEGSNGNGTTTIYPAGVPVWEDRGDGYGGGLDIFGAYSNLSVAPDDFSAAQWSYGLGDITYTAPPVPGGLGPDGATQAPRLFATDPTASTGAVFRTIGGGGNGRLSVWYKNDVTDPPTGPGALMASNSGGPGANFFLTPTWSFASVYAFGNSDPLIYPAGAQMVPPSDLPGSTQTFFPTESGAVNLHGFQLTIGQIAAVPLVRGATGQVSAKIDASVIVNAIGDLDVTLDVSPFYDNTQETPQLFVENFYLASLPCAGGLYAVRFLAATAQWVVTDNGVDVMTTANYNSSPTPELPPSFQAGFRAGDRVQMQLVRKASTGQCGLVLTVNGCSGDPSTYALPPGGPLVPTDGLYLGSDSGTSGPAAIHVQTVSENVSNAPFARTPQGVYVGDSQTASISGFVTVGSRVLTAAEALTRPVIATVAVAGATIADSVANLELSPVWTGPPPVWLILRAGVNDLLIGDTAAQALASMQAAVNTIAAHWPTTKIFLSIQLPDWGALTALQQGYWTVFNAGLPAIVGQSDIFSTGSLAVNNGSNSYIPIANAGDNLHPNDYGRILIAAGDRADLASNGILV